MGEDSTVPERLAGRTAFKTELLKRFLPFPIFNIKGIWRETGQNIAFWETSNQMA